MKYYFIKTDYSCRDYSGNVVNHSSSIDSTLYDYPEQAQKTIDDLTKHQVYNDEYYTIYEVDTEAMTIGEYVAPKIRKKRVKK